MDYSCWLVKINGYTAHGEILLSTSPVIICRTFILTDLQLSSYGPPSLYGITVSRSPCDSAMMSICISDKLITMGIPKSTMAMEET